LSLESTFGNDGTELHECIPDKMPMPSPLEQVHNEQISSQIDDVLKSLSPRDEKILRLRFGIGVNCEYTLQEIGKTLGVSRERIRQIEISAIKKIKNSRYLIELMPLISN
jgi:RNA polymerase sigma factor (sigma-70 family)